MHSYFISHTVILLIPNAALIGSTFYYDIDWQDKWMLWMTLWMQLARCNMSLSVNTPCALARPPICVGIPPKPVCLIDNFLSTCIVEFAIPFTLPFANLILKIKSSFCRSQRPAWLCYILIWGLSVLGILLKTLHIGLGRILYYDLQHCKCSTLETRISCTEWWFQLYMLNSLSRNASIFYSLTCVACCALHQLRFSRQEKILPSSRAVNHLF
jgi:hypothetical protein